MGRPSREKIFHEDAAGRAAVRQGTFLTTVGIRAATRQRRRSSNRRPSAVRRKASGMTRRGRRLGVSAASSERRTTMSIAIHHALVPAPSQSAPGRRARIGPITSALAGPARGTTSWRGRPMRMLEGPAPGHPVEHPARFDTAGRRLGRADARQARGEPTDPCTPRPAGAPDRSRSVFASQHHIPPRLEQRTRAGSPRDDRIRPRSGSWSSGESRLGLVVDESDRREVTRPPLGHRVLRRIPGMSPMVTISAVSQRSQNSPGPAVDPGGLHSTEATVPLTPSGVRYSPFGGLPAVDALTGSPGHA
ncbi:hypothetical protein BKA25_002710 [Actinoalloteichus hymeniacidonis]|uniref:Uncharacterized protein n=1 Tax=Actinoalloteichus hymeniacidonis TaxID=340345 RepID=A0AAC9HSB8_9PSEU|nr:hypothetical protein TL08_13730 [Actinoalloteichus hymeniacidonis]MBB5908394.1 hypothetical protein [Actinoalloteichus hymeniacidonis]